MKLARTEKQKDDLLNRCADLDDSGKNPFFGMTYAQGVQNGINWMLGDMDEDPLEE